MKNDLYFYLCDGKACENKGFNCYVNGGSCKHTGKPEHARYTEHKNFDEVFTDKINNKTFHFERPRKLAEIAQYFADHPKETAHFISDACKNLCMPRELEEIIGCAIDCRYCVFADENGNCDVNKIMEVLNK